MATNYIGELISIERIRRGWRFGDLARACGAVTAKQTSRISSRLVLFEREGVRNRGLLRKVVVALEIDPVVVNELLRRQRDEKLDEWNRWADERVPMKLHIRPSEASGTANRCRSRSKVRSCKPSSTHDR